MELLPPPSLMRPMVTGAKVAGCAAPSGLLAPAAPTPTIAVETVAAIMTPAASSPVAKTFLPFPPVRRIAPVLSTVFLLGDQGTMSVLVTNRSGPPAAVGKEDTI
jgi:hypothetical protein